MSEKLTQNNNYSKWFGEIKSRIQTSQQRAALKVNQELLGLYWFIGEVLSETQSEWGNKFISHLARDLKIEFPQMKGFSQRNLEQMRRWYSFHSSNIVIAQQLVAQMNFDPDIVIAQQLVAQLQGIDNEVDVRNTTSMLFNIPWGHHLLIITKIKDPKTVYFYCIKTIQNGWSRSVLQAQIESNLYERQGQALTNFNLTLPDFQADLAQETLKNPYNFDFLTLTKDSKELDLERGLIEHIKKFLLELGKGFAYVGNQYNLNVDGDDFFLDLLFFNINLNCYIIFELKVGDFKAEYAGKLNMYVNIVNDKVKKDFHEETIGVLLCKTPSKAVVEYSIKGIETPLGVTSYALKKALPKEYKKAMPTIKELQEELTTEIKIQKTDLERQREKLIELIGKSNSSELEQQKSHKSVQGVIENVYIKLISKINTRIDHLAIKDWYLSLSKSYNLDSQACTSLDEFKASLIENPNPTNINYHISFNDFKKTRVQIFHNNLRLILNFSTNTYALGFNHGIVDEFLYSHRISEKRLEELSALIVSQLMDDIQKDLESRIEK